MVHERKIGMSKKVTVIVEGREYIVEVGDLSESPIRATVNERTYNVQVPSVPAAKPAAPAATAAPKPVPAAPAPTPAAPAIPTPASSPGSMKAITAPMPGDILQVEVEKGTNVRAGDVICVLEAMKMKNMIRSPQAGVIASVEVLPGQAVDYGAVLVTFE